MLAASCEHPSPRLGSDAALGSFLMQWKIWYQPTNQNTQLTKKNNCPSRNLTNRKENSKMHQKISYQFKPLKRVPSKVIHCHMWDITMKSSNLVQMDVYVMFCNKHTRCTIMQGKENTGPTCVKLSIFNIRVSECLALNWGDKTSLWLGRSGNVTVSHILYRVTKVIETLLFCRT